MKKFLRALKFWKKEKNPARPAPKIEQLPPNLLSGADAILTSNEVTPRHGTGVILERFFATFPNVLSIRTESHYNGEQNFGAAKLQMNFSGLGTREQMAERLKFCLNGTSVGRILCIPYHKDELITAILLRQVFNAPLCIYLMDDNNIMGKGIPDDLMREALEAADLRLAISPEFRDSYEDKYGQKIFVLPPLVNSVLLQTTPTVKNTEHFQNKTGVLLGNVWSQQWFLQLRRTLREAGVRVHWFGNTQASWLKYNPRELEADGIINCGFVPEEELIAQLRNHPFAIIPSGSLDEQDDRPEIARLSQPSRMPYMMAVANIPMVVMGSPETAAARFVQRFQSGKCCPYEATALRQTVDSICREDEQWFFRRNAAEKGKAFSLEHPGQWIWDSLAAGKVVDETFEKMMPRLETKVASSVPSGQSQ